MNPAEPIGPFGPSRRSRLRAVGWALGFSVVTTIGLGVLTWMLLLVHTLSYGVGVVVQGAGISSPADKPYGPGFAAAVAVNLTTAALLAWIAARSRIRGWPPVAQGLTAALFATALGVCVLLVSLNINPVG